MTDQNAQPPQESTAKMSEISRIIGVITAPRATFEDIVRSPSWLLPFLLVVAVSVMSTFILSDLIAKAQMEKMSLQPNLTQEQIDMAVNMTRKFSWISGLVAVPIFYVIAAAVLLFTGSVVLGGESKFKTVFSVTCWGGIITVITSLISVPLMLFRGELESATSLVFLAPGDDKTSFIYSFFKSIDLLTFWYVAVLGIGFAAAYKFTNQKGITVTVVWWLILVLIGAAWTAMFS